MSTYLGRAAIEQLGQAQAVVDRHLVACAVCGTNTKCAERLEAEQVFIRYERLPRRTPGLTQLTAKAWVAWLRG